MYDAYSFLPRLSFSKGAQRFIQEAVMWRHLKHPNIVPLRGVATALPQFVSEWMDNGTLTEYVKKHPGASRLGLVCFPHPTRGKSLIPPPISCLMSPRV